MRGPRADLRVLIYSHDSFGLGHLRRCRAIAHALVERNRNMSVLILTGSPIVGSFDFRARVDFVRVPGVIKLRNGEYTSLSLHIDIENTIALRESIIQHTADTFDPDIFIVDKEPLGLRGEVTNTLEMLKARGTPLVLGLRDVMDEPAALAPEWARKNVIPALRDLYDQIWVYGLPEICDPIEDIALPRDVRSKVTYTGYLKRNVPKAVKSKGAKPPFEEPYLLVTAGGGGDGEEMIDWVLRAYEYDRNAPHPALIVFGPFMKPESQAAFVARAEKLPRVRTLTFDTRMETLMAKSAGVVAMGGYNTFCEILSFDKPAIIVPRTKPRLEQFIRAQRAEQLGMVRMMKNGNGRDARAMAGALRALPEQGRPSAVVVPGLLDGLGNLDRLAAQLMGTEAHAKVAV
jgi:predicted glycosyltransferase